jgi:hypothetical protein
MSDPLPNPFIPDDATDIRDDGKFTLDPDAFMAAIVPGIPDQKKQLTAIDLAPSMVGPDRKSYPSEFVSYDLELLAKLARTNDRSGSK